MMHNYRESAAVCGGCGATAEERKVAHSKAPQGLSQCPWCGADKCCVCDMGDDVECGSCGAQEEVS